MQSFWLNNIHFAIEFFGATVLIVAALLALDAYVFTREKKALLKVFGFGCFAAWQVLHALDVTREEAVLLGMLLLGGGLLLILLDLYVEAPPGRPKTFELLFYIPPVMQFAGYVFAAVGVLAALIAGVAWRRYSAELNKPLKPFFSGFGLLAVSYVLGGVAARHLAPDSWWIAEHAVRMGGFVLLTLWVWQYLQLRLKEQLLLIFVTMSLLVSLVVTFTFSALLLSRMRADASLGLRANVRTLLYVFTQKGEEAKAKSIIAANDPVLQEAMRSQDFAGIEERAKSLREMLGVDFLTLTAKTGEVLERATYRTVRGDTLEKEPVVKAALVGDSAAALSNAAPEILSVRGAASVRAADASVVGAAMAGFLLDTVFLESFKKTTGLDATIFAGDTLHASTITDSDGKTRPVGTTVSDASVRKAVLENRQPYSGSTYFLGRSHLASYLPLQDANGLVMGMVAVSRPETEISKVAIATNRLTLFTTLIIVLALLLPAWAVVKKITEEV